MRSPLNNPRKGYMYRIYLLIRIFGASSFCLYIFFFHRIFLSSIFIFYFFSGLWGVSLHTHKSGSVCSQVKSSQPLTCLVIIIVSQPSLLSFIRVDREEIIFVSITATSSRQSLFFTKYNLNFSNCRCIDLLVPNTNKPCTECRKSEWFS